ncbi:hypothetical protein HX089_05270 [Myroides odoratimimus]|uniref:hypothetical protein n=1 Tax=Myroides odoratimimus TaxID=76832 RepID=UPI0025784A85|nr:hypothetical protein [Myroides odoratimimus]MDM1505374.1 hypothetical protein [Myroides odoratimimus]MDM1515801.1 hypothetical protein [Myroides odoratimimus]
MVLFQTLENRENYDEILSEGPFECNRSDAWLTAGYYFWDSHIELAHWWGNNSYGGKYLITKVKLSNQDEIFDLHNNSSHRDELRYLIKKLEKEKELPRRAKLPDVLLYLRKNGIFNQKGIRMEGKNSFKKWYHNIWGPMKVTIKKEAFLDLIPPIQVCVFDKSILEMETYEIIYPSKISEISKEELF